MALAENTKIHSIRGTRSGLWWVTKALFNPREPRGPRMMVMVELLSPSLFLSPFFWKPRARKTFFQRDSIQRRRRKKKGEKEEDSFSGSGPEDRKRWSRDSGQKKVGGGVCYAAPGTNLDGVMSLRGLLFPLAFHIPFSFHSIP